MKGATAEPSVSTIKTESSKIVATIGPSHHFFRTFMNDQSSPKIASRPKNPPEERAIEISLFRACRANGARMTRAESVERVTLAPVKVLVQLGLLLLQEDLIAEGEDIHLGPHEAEVRVVGCTDDRLSADIE